MRVLVKEGAKVNTPTPKDKIGPLHHAAQKGKANCVAALLELGAKVDKPTKEGLTPLHLACELGYGKCLPPLFKNGADLNATSRLGQTPLVLACDGGHADIVRYP